MLHNIFAKVWASLMTAVTFGMFKRYSKQRQHEQEESSYYQRIKEVLAKKYKPMRLRNKTSYGRMRKAKRNISYQSKLRNRYGLN